MPSGLTGCCTERHTAIHPHQVSSEIHPKLSTSTQIDRHNTHRNKLIDTHTHTELVTRRDKVEMPASRYNRHLSSKLVSNTDLTDDDIYRNC